MNDHSDAFLYGPLPEGYRDYERRRLKAEWDRRQGYIERAEGQERAWKEHCHPKLSPAGDVCCRKCFGAGELNGEPCWCCDGTGSDAARVVIGHTVQYLDGIVDRYIERASK